MQSLLLPLIIARTQIALWEKGCYVRGRSSGKTGPPASPTLSPWEAGGLKRSHCLDDFENSITRAAALPDHPSRPLSCEARSPV